MLHITNGDAVSGTFREARLEGQYLPWRDVLHDGPVPGGLELEELSAIRAEFIASLGWGPYDRTRAEFARRDSTLREWPKHEEVVLWFEHDLYDQLQLIQLLDFFADQDPAGTKLTLINIDEFPGVEPFHGLGELNGQQLTSLLPSRQPVVDAQLELGTRAWSAFRSEHPTELVSITESDTAALPFLHAALGRWLEEFPSSVNGLSRTEGQLLQAAEAGPLPKESMYLQSQAHEEAVFMGDSSAFWRIARLGSGRCAALERSADRNYGLTEFGRELLQGNADWIASSQANFWLGGVHIAPDRCWRWHPKERGLRQQ